MQKRIDSSGANGAWLPCNTSSPSQSKKLSQKAIREEQYLFLLDEVETWKDRCSWLEEELSETLDALYRSEHGLPIIWRDSDTQERDLEEIFDNQKFQKLARERFL